MTNVSENNRLSLSKDQIKLRQAVGQTWQFIKQGKGYLGSLAVQSTLIYIAFMLLMQAIFGDASLANLFEVLGRGNPEELVHYGIFDGVMDISRSILDWIFPFLLEASMVVYLCRRFVENDNTKSEIIDLNLKNKEIRVFGILALLSVLWLIVSVIFVQFTENIKLEKNTIMLAVKIGVLLLLAIGGIYSNLRLTFASLLKGLNLKNVFKKSWNLTSNKVWFLGLFTSLLYIPSVLTNVFKSLLIELVKNTPLLQSSSVTFGIFLITDVLSMLTKVILFYSGLIVVYKTLQQNQTIQESTSEVL